MPLPENVPDCWVKLTAHGILHFVHKGETTTACGIPARNAAMGHRAEDVDQLPEYERPRRCPTCLRAGRRLGHK